MEEEIAAFVLGAIGSAHGCELELGDEQGAQEVGFVVAHAALAEVGDEDAGVVHDEGDGDAVPHLAEDIADDGRLEQGTDFVLNRGDGFPHEAWIVGFELLLPELADEGIADLFDHPTAISRINEHPIDAEQGGVLAVEQGGDGVVEYVLHPWPPRISPDGFEGFDDAGRHQWAVIGRDVCQWIEPDGELNVSGIEINEVIRPAGRNLAQQVLGKIAVGINDGDAVAPVDVLDDEVAKQGRLSRTRLSDDVEVMPGILWMDAEWNLTAPCEAMTDDEWVV